jgi:hypothetical protein
MLLRQRRSFILDSRLALVAANFPAQTIRVPIPRIAPYALEEIFVVVTLTMAALINAGILGYGIMNVIKRIQLGNIPNSDGKPSNVVDVTGPGLLQFAANEGLNMDHSTLATLYANNLGGTVAKLMNGGVYRITYRIPLVHPFLTDGLRPRCLLPIFAYNQDPILQLDFAGALEMSATANPFSAAAVEIFLVSREMQPAAVTAINASGGFINSDLIESQNAPPISMTNQQFKILVPTPGGYTGILIHSLKGGATQIPGDLSGTQTVGAETEWQLKGAGKDIIDSWRMKYMQILNDLSKPFNGVALSNNDLAAYAAATPVNGVVAVPSFGGTLSTGFAVQDPSSVFLDFASDGLTDVRELGSLFNTKQYADKALEVAIYANLTTSATATQPNLLNLVGRRLFGDLTAFQTLSGL